MGYTLKDVDEAELRIRRECPTALINRCNYDWSLAVTKADKSECFFVFDCDRNAPTVIGDLDKIITLLKTSP